MFPTQRVRRNLTDLEYLARAKQAVRSRHLADAPEDLILAIIDVAKALIRGKLKLTNSQLAQAKNNKRDLLKLTRSTVGLRTKRKLLDQKGNLLGLLLGPLNKGISAVAGPLLGSIFGGGRK